MMFAAAGERHTCLPGVWLSASHVWILILILWKAYDFNSEVEGGKTKHSEFKKFAQGQTIKCPESRDLNWMEHSW